MDFGFTNDKERYDAAIAYKDSAIADGWSLKTEENGNCDYFILNREGFTMHCMARLHKSTCKWKYQAEVTIWGPDGLQIRVPDMYDWEEIQKRVDVCMSCGAVGKIQRVGFAGRYCSKCVPAQRKIQEFPGWTN